MRFTEKQLNRVSYLVSGSYLVVDDPIETERNLTRALAEIESPEELHLFAANYVWECGIELLKRILFHPLCDKGTGMLIYFTARPEFLYRRFQEGEPFLGDQSKWFGFLKMIEKICARDNFPSKRIRVNPTAVAHRNALEKPGSELIPAIMKTPTEGEPVETFRVG